MKKYAKISKKYEKKSNKGKNRMYFINIKQLKEDIVNHEFREKDRFIYVFISIILYTIFTELSFLASLESSTIPLITDYISSAGTVIITIMGTYYLYRANGGDSGEDFLGRYFSIVWVVSIRLMIPYIIVATTLIVIMSTGGNEIILEIIFMLSTLIYYFAVYFCSYGHLVDIYKKMNA